MKKKEKYQYVNREISWLHFNERVLQEASDTSVPLITRLHFLGIFSNNLDEFFKVRYATIRRMVEANKRLTTNFRFDPKELLDQITKKVIVLQEDSLNILREIESKLKEENIYIIDENEVSDTQKEFLHTYFIRNISPAISTIILDDDLKFPMLKDSAINISVKLTLEENNKTITKYALIEIPRNVDRFIVLPEENDHQYIIMLDDVIRLSLPDIFNVLKPISIAAHMIKITRDAELDIENDLSKSFIEKISSSVKERTHNQPVRLVYDKEIESDTLDFFMQKMNVRKNDSLIPGGRYHHRRDYMNFPTLGKTHLVYQNIPSLPIEGLDLDQSILEAVEQRDYLQNTPYHSFAYVVKFLKEAALHPKVKSIKITAYRLADISHVINALVNAQKNGKEVTVLIEVQARFDEEANIKHARVLESEGVKTIFGVAGLKTHSKICVIEMLDNKKIKRYGFISTGNFNESSAKIYTDYTLLTAHQEILKDVNKIFGFFDVNYKIPKYKHLIVSPHYTQKSLIKLIEQEIKNAKNGLPSYIKIKLNSLSSHKMIDHLYKASIAGVKIQLIVRGVCCLIPNIKGMSNNIEVISIVDRYLEHNRLLIFGNNNDPKIYISSADWMSRNLHHRVEVTCPIYDENVKQELLDTFEISWQDNIKARISLEGKNNLYREAEGKPIRSQFEMYHYYQNH